MKAAMRTNYDAIVVGARCAGAATAMLLARAGYQVLVADRATFPSDTVSTHIIHPRGVAALARWGLRDRLAATRCPPIETYVFDFGALTICGAPGTEDTRFAYCPRRTILDKLLVDAAAEAGAEIREGFTVEAVVMEGGRVIGMRGHSRAGAPVVEHASVVIGADGRHSVVAKAVDSERYNEKPPLASIYYTYWSGLPMDGRWEIYSREACGFAAVPTHDGLTLAMALWPYAGSPAKKHDVELHYWRVLEQMPELARRIRGARREASFAGAAIPNFFRKPYGNGWVLVGDAGYLKDPVTAQGITDAFLDAERCATALDECFRGTRSFDEAMHAYQRDRDEHALPMYEFTCQLATLGPPDEGLQQLLAVIHGNQRLMDAFAQSYAGTISPSEFFAPQNVGAIIATSRHER
jgi:2-polyprenyl-6-methoxyphenol hydroxylase-like FAD-dependent oxidoreductase